MMDTFNLLDKICDERGECPLLSEYLNFFSRVGRIVDCSVNNKKRQNTCDL